MQIYLTSSSHPEENEISCYPKSKSRPYLSNFLYQEKSIKKVIAQCWSNWSGVLEVMTSIWSYPVVFWDEQLLLWLKCAHLRFDNGPDEIRRAIIQSHLVWIMGKVTWTILGRIYYFSTIFFFFLSFSFSFFIFNDNIFKGNFNNNVLTISLSCFLETQKGDKKQKKCGKGKSWSSIAKILLVIAWSWSCGLVGLVA